jgi:hypothetical protein
MDGVPLGDFYFEAGEGRAGDLVEGHVKSVRRDIAEGELSEVRPKAAPPAGEGAGEGSSAGATETSQDLEQHVIRKGVDQACSAAIREVTRPETTASSGRWLRPEAAR